jgi:hypothetical protein
MRYAHSSHCGRCLRPCVSRFGRGSRPTDSNRRWSNTRGPGADDGKDHVEYELLVINVFPEAVTLSSVTVLDPAGKELMRVEGDALTAATQTVFARTPTAVIPASAAVSVDVDLIIPPDSAPEWVTHRIGYTLEAGSELAMMVGSLEVNAPEVAINRQPAMVIRPPLRGRAGSRPALAAGRTSIETFV